MDHLSLSLTLFTLISLSSFSGVEPITFKFINKCRHTIWPGLLSGAGTAQLPTTGFYLNSGSGAQPPATLAEFTLNGADGLDFYDVSLVDGYNLPMLVIPKKVTRGGCGATGCLIDLNGACPKELRLSPATGGKGAVACRSACEAFGDPRFCCSEGYATPETCGPSVYSLFFKHACPRSYSYAYDDKTSTYTCAATDYDIIFCPLPYTSIIEQSFWKENAVVESSPSTVHGNSLVAFEQLTSELKVLVETNSQKLLALRKDGVELPLVNKTTMYQRSHGASSPGVVQQQFLAGAASIVTALLLFRPPLFPL
ncbi:thaumatin-like protein 1b isoform X1 [Populus alba x Populus x berolinensis]|nr:thaumatin-like protein 1b isoform X1 [Populus alba x Populus x berolinensis]